MVARLRRHRALLFAITGGVAFALTAPPTNLYPFVIVGLALLAVSMLVVDGPAGGPGILRVFGRGAAWGTAAGIVGLRFVPAVIQRFTPLGVAAAYLALVLLAAAQSLIWALGAAVASFLHRRARAPIELAFAAGIFLAVSLPTIFAWTPAGLVSPWPAFVQLADVVGERGVSALFAVGAALLCRAALALFGLTPRTIGIEMRPARPPRLVAAIAVPALGAAGLFAALAIHGVLRMRSITRATEELPTVHVGLIDQSVDPHERWETSRYGRILNTLRELTQEVEAEGAELTIWPEAAYPFPLDHDARVAPTGPRAILGPKVHGPLLIGLITVDPPVPLVAGGYEMNSFNSATVVMPDGSMQAPYDKLQLLWFGETIPAASVFPWLRHTFQRSGALLPGTTARALELPRDLGPALRMGVLNCYEDTLPDIGRRAAALGPNLLVNITNDAWFFGTAEPELHARLGAMRAVELRLDLVRAVNMGVMSWIDAAGTTRRTYAGTEAATMMAVPAVRDGVTTLYGRAGDWPMRALLTAATALCMWRGRPRAGGAPS